MSVTSFMPQPRITGLLRAANNGGAESRRELFEAVYTELQQIAQAAMRKERIDHTLQPTAVVNEALLRLLDGDALANLTTRAQFYGAVSRVMRQVLVDHARGRQSQKRGGHCRRIPLDALLDHFEERHTDPIALDDAITELESHNSRQAEVITLRVLGGCQMKDIASYLDVSLGTVERDYRLARAWLRTRLDDSSR